MSMSQHWLERRYNALSTNCSAQAFSFCSSRHGSEILLGNAYNAVRCWHFLLLRSHCVSAILFKGWHGGRCDMKFGTLRRLHCPKVNWDRAHLI